MKTEADLLAEEADRIALGLQEVSAAHFRVGELIWLQYFLSKLRWNTSVETEKRNLKDVTDLKDRVTQRMK